MESVEGLIIPGVADDGKPGSEHSAESQRQLGTTDTPREG